MFVVPSHSHFGFYNHDVANKFRKNVLEMCDIKPRAEYPKKPKILFFFERGFNRQILNGETLCNSTKNDTSLRGKCYPRPVIDSSSLSGLVRRFAVL